MPDFSEVIEELTGAGYTESEAIQATVALARIPQIDLLLGNPVAAEFMVKVLLRGFEPSNDYQKALVEGISSFAKRERQCYFMHTVEGMSFSKVAAELGISKGSVQQSIERARKKLNSVIANQQRNAL